MRPQVVGDQPLRNKGIFLQELAHQFQRRALISLRLGQHIEDLALSVDSVVYFAGHGFVSQQSEFWLLSNAPHNPKEAISLTASAYLARYSTIPNVVFISDALPLSRRRADTANIKGQNIFPSPGPTPAASVNVDQFLATHIGDSAYEAPLSDSVRDFHGIHTQALIAAFANPPSNLVQQIDGEAVIPDRDLERYLLDEVPKRASAGRDALLKWRIMALRGLASAVVVLGLATAGGRAAELRSGRTTLSGGSKRWR